MCVYGEMTKETYSFNVNLLRPPKEIMIFHCWFDLDGLATGNAYKPDIVTDQVGIELTTVMIWVFCDINMWSVCTAFCLLCYFREPTEMRSFCHQPT